MGSPPVRPGRAGRIQRPASVSSIAPNGAARTTSSPPAVRTRRHASPCRRKASRLSRGRREADHVSRSAIESGETRQRRRRRRRRSGRFPKGAQRHGVEPIPEACAGLPVVEHDTTRESISRGLPQPSQAAPRRCVGRGRWWAPADRNVLAAADRKVGARPNERGLPTRPSCVPRTANGIPARGVTKGVRLPVPADALVAGAAGQAGRIRSPVSVGSTASSGSALTTPSPPAVRTRSHASPCRRTPIPSSRSGMPIAVPEPKETLPNELVAGRRSGPGRGAASIPARGKRAPSVHARRPLRWGLTGANCWSRTPSCDRPGGERPADF